MSKCSQSLIIGKLLVNSFRKIRTKIPCFTTGAIDIFKEIYDELTVSFTSVESIRNPSTKRQLPSFEETIEAIEQISPHISLNVLNGRTTDRLQYDVNSDSDGNKIIPKDVYTIAVGGNNLGRGITLSGLCTTVFTTNRGADDTDVQKQRWFGYRGSHLEFVRIYCPSYVWESDTPESEEGFREKNDTLMNLYESIFDNWNNRFPRHVSSCMGIFSWPRSMISRKVPQAHICRSTHTFL